MPLISDTKSVAFNPRGLDSLKVSAAQSNDKATIHKAASQFESYFIQQMMKTMRTSLPNSESTSSDLKAYTEMFDQQVASVIANGKGLGLADQLSAQIALQVAK